MSASRLLDPSFDFVPNVPRPDVPHEFSATLREVGDPTYWVEGDGRLESRCSPYWARAPHVLVLGDGRTVASWRCGLVAVVLNPSRLDWCYAEALGARPHAKSGRPAVGAVLRPSNSINLRGET